MLRINTMARFVSFLFVFLSVGLNATEKTHKYEVASGIVFYDIQGEAALTPETNLSISGTAKLRFKEWGDILLQENNAEVLTTGAIQHKQQFKSLVNVQHNKVITVDYENEQLLEGKRSLLTLNAKNELEGLVEDGEEMVAGFLCTVWKSANSKKCLYKGVVLKQESTILGVSYVKVAKSARFDINASEEACHLPDYPLQDIGLFKDNPKTKNSKKRENLCKLLNKSSFEKEAKEQKFSTHNRENETRQRFINYIGKEIFMAQKEFLPQLLTVLKETRVCWYKAEDAVEAERCFESFKNMKASQGVELEKDFSDWTHKGKERVLDNIEDDIISFQSRMPCVNRAKNITDLSSCMK
ncbi:MAG: hypothetical protein GQ531_01320 [Sulfurovum sp.]|nr:hypothetical protein [Sulfurovum sp.]